MEKATLSDAVVLEDTEDEAESSGAGRRQNRTKLTVRSSLVLDSEIDRFRATLQENYAAQVAIDHERLCFEREKHLEDKHRYEEQRQVRKEQAELDRAERNQERENFDRIEL